jgi:hypothetical protein
VSGHADLEDRELLAGLSQGRRHGSPGSLPVTSHLPVSSMAIAAFLDSQACLNAKAWHVRSQSFFIPFSLRGNWDSASQCTICV